METGLVNLATSDTGWHKAAALGRFPELFFGAGELALDVLTSAAPGGLRC